MIVIKDTGCGIPKEYIQRVKERFFRVDSARNKSSGGSGLGLSIVNACITAMGGELQIKSEQGKGSEFIIVLPRYNFIKF
jgi:two-component system phosphate regulon sensor histidine kinase PhoR